MAVALFSKALGGKFTVGKAGTVEFYPPPSHGQASSAAITALAVGGTALSTPVSGDAMTVSTVSTTLSAEPSKGDDSVTVASATGINVGESYIIETYGQRERVVVRAVNSTTITLADNLRLDHVITASTFKGHRISFTMVAGNNGTADRNYHAALTWTDEDGTVHDAGLTYHVVYQPWRLWTTEEDILRSLPDAAYQRHVRERADSFETDMRLAEEEIALRFIRPIRRFEDQFLDTQAFEKLHLCILRRMIAEKLFANDPDRLERISAFWDAKCVEEWDRLAMSLPPYDGDNDGVIDETGEEAIQEVGALHLPTSWPIENPDGVTDTDLFKPRFLTVATTDKSRTRW